MALGFYLSGHPLDDYEDQLHQAHVVSSGDVASRVGEGEQHTLQMAGVVREVTRRRSKSGKPFGWLALSDRTGDYEVTVFSEVLESADHLLETGTRVFLSVTAEEREGNLRLTAEKVTSLDALARQRAGRGLRVTVQDPAALPEIRRRLEMLQSADSTGELVFVLPAREAGVEVEIAVPDKVTATPSTKGALKMIGGVADVVLH